MVRAIERHAVVRNKRDFRVLFQIAGFNCRVPDGQPPFEATHGVEDSSKCVDIFTSVCTMRTNIVIDDKLMSDTLRVTGLKTKREAVELGLRTLLRLQQQTELRKLRGKYQSR
jgi:Arc/MetJ family transcription regulator